MDPTGTDTAPSSTPPANPLASMTPDARDAWRADDSTFDYGTTPAASSPAAPVVQATSTDAISEPASEPGAPPKKNADTRIQELLAERAELRARLDAATRPAQTPDAAAASSPASVEAEFPEYDAWTEQAGNESKTYTQYQVALSRHVYAQEQAAIRQREDAQASERADADRVRKFHESSKTFVEDHADYWEKVNPITQTNLGSPARVAAFNDAIDASSNAPALLYHLGTHPEIFARLITLPERLATWELGKIEAALSSSALPGIPANPPKLITSASPPPKLVNQRPAEAADPVLAAVNGGDYRAFNAAEEARERARR